MRAFSYMIVAYRVFLVELLGLLGDQLGLGPAVLLDELVVFFDEVGEFLLDADLVLLFEINFSSRSSDCVRA